jgi:WNK lysine deficient protein kinase
VLPSRYQHLITGEINSILRELNRPAADEKNLEEKRQWNSLSRMESLGRDSNSQFSEGHISLSRRNSYSDIWNDADNDFPMIGRIIFDVEYSDDQDVDCLINDTAAAVKRIEKAKEWSQKIKNQDILTVGNLRDLQEEDWLSL